MNRSPWNLTAIAVVGAISLGCGQSEPTTKSPLAASTSTATEEHAHGAGPSGGVVFDLGSHHAEFTVDHGAKLCMILFLGDDEKTPAPIAATEFVLRIKETKTADGTVVAPMTVTMQPVDPVDGKAAKFVGTDPGIGNVADFAGTVSGEIDGKPAMGEFAE
ncbi:hypothetical protein [Botrimarina mediterranea]|uniref:Lipoprotein n=1 Tax=Botrimarina mediterranea TaxID=2528022 RepID=A0A518KC83_9BACT|nr:hypothetical protein [Botrimarina mediterranea]QDV75385.1 hypothetical protein Spa11_36020 [Botrimarina mediterranea]